MNIPEPLDDDLLRICRDKPGTAESRAAFRRIADRYASRLFGSLRAYRLDEATVEDLAQEVLLTLFRELPRWTEGTPLRPWLLRTARHRALNHLRQSRRHAAGTLDGAADGDASIDVPDPRSTAEAGDAAGAGRGMPLQRALDRLPETWREIVILHHLKGLPYEEVAQIVETTPGSARVLMHKALIRLRQIMKGVNEEKGTAP